MTPAVALLPTAPPADTVDETRALGRFANPLTDTLIQLNSRHYRLTIQSVADSTRPLEYAPAESVGEAYAAPSDTSWQAHRVRGYAGTYTFALRDSTGQATLFTKRLHKSDFYRVAPQDIVTVSEPEFCYVGYSNAFEALVFVGYFGIPYSDVGYRATLLLDAHSGRVKSLKPSGSAYAGSIDCDPRVSPSGRAVLTCREVLRAGQAPLNLLRPHAELQAARFLNDTTLLVLYQHGDYRLVKHNPLASGTATGKVLGSPVAGAAETAPVVGEDIEFISTPVQQRLPTALVLSTSGRVVREFRLTPVVELSTDLPRTFVKPTRTYYFLETDTKLVLIPKAHPDSIIELPIKGLLRFVPPKKPCELKRTLFSQNGRVALYIDTVQPRRVRYQRLKD